MNKWHFKHPGDEHRTICGRTTARRITADINIFKRRPCKNCSKALKELR